MVGTKNSIRREMRGRRERLLPAVVQSTGEAVLRYVLDLPPYRKARTVLAYVSDENEVPTADLLRLALEEGKHVFLPRMHGRRMTFGAYGPDWPLCPGRFGIEEATGPSFEPHAGEPFVVLVPVVAWDARGARLGRGGGYYDKSLSRFGAERCLIGLAYSFQQCTRLPVDPWDVFLDYVVTERGALRCQGGGDPPAERREEEQSHGTWMDRDRRRPGGCTRTGL